MKKINQKIEKIVRYIFMQLGIVFFFVILWYGLKYILYDDTSSYTRVMMHELYEQERIDYLFFGASPSCRSFDPSQLDKELDAITFNAGSSWQTIEVTYYLMKDVLNRTDVKNIYVDVNPIVTAKYGEIKHTNDMNRIYIIADYMKPSLEKYSLILSTTNSQNYVNGFLYARRTNQKIYDEDYIVEVINKKGTSSYKNYKYDLLTSDEERYAGKGYIERNTKVEEGYYTGYIQDESRIAPENIDESWYEYIDKIIELCSKKNVKLTFVTTPIPECGLYYYKDYYDIYHNRVKKITDEAGIDYLDFSLVKEEYFPVDAKYFMDNGHMNMYGAKIFNSLFADVIKGETEMDDICYSSLTERLEHSEERMYGLMNDGKDYIIYANNSGSLMFRVKIETEDGDSYYYQDYSDNTKIIVPENMSGTITVYVKNINAPEEIKEYNYSF